MQVERKTYIRIGESPVGPFGPRIDIYRTREPDLGEGIYTYNAKSHPSLSPTGQSPIVFNLYLEKDTNYEHFSNLNGLGSNKLFRRVRRLGDEEF